MNSILFQTTRSISKKIINSKKIYALRLFRCQNYSNISKNYLISKRENNFILLNKTPSSSSNILSLNLFLTNKVKFILI